MNWDFYCRLDPLRPHPYHAIAFLPTFDSPVLPYQSTSSLPLDVIHQSPEADRRWFPVPAPGVVQQKPVAQRAVKAGRPLGMDERRQILALYERGHKISHIARIIGVTHSCVSKIMSRYRRTGSMCPRSSRLSECSSRSESDFSDANSLASSETDEQETPTDNEGRREAIRKPPLPYSIEKLLS